MSAERPQLTKRELAVLHRVCDFMLQAEMELEPIEELWWYFERAEDLRHDAQDLIAKAEVIGEPLDEAGTERHEQ